MPRYWKWGAAGVASVQRGQGCPVLDTGCSRSRRCIKCQSRDSLHPILDGTGEKLKGIRGSSNEKKLLCAKCNLPLHLPASFRVRSLRQRSEGEPGKEKKERYSFIV